MANENGADPIARLRRWWKAAERAGIPLAETMALATADARGMPSVRFVLLKDAGARGLTFFTDGRSRKGAELRCRPRAALAFYWHATGKQVRVEGRTVEMTPAEVDAYWETRPRESRLAALTSQQSARLASRAALLRAWRANAKCHRGRPIPRPLEWTGYRLIPDAVEFWTRGAHRLHHRERFVRRREGWTRTLLQP